MVSKALYKPLSLVSSVLGGMLAGAVFTKVWSLVADEEPPTRPRSITATARC